MTNLRTLLLPGLLPLLFSACDPRETAAPPPPASPLYECAGQPPYASKWEDIVAGLDSDGVAYCAPPPPAGALPRAGDAANEGLDTVRVRQIILDAQCRFLASSDTLLVRAADGPRLGASAWDFRLADGSPAPTGEYFINTVWEGPDGRRDTTFEKTGYIRLECAH